MKILFSLLFLFTFLSPQLFAQTDASKRPDLSKLALEYMQAYSKWDIDKMGTMLTDSVHFTDPTAVEVFNNGSDVKGKEAVVKFLKDIFKETPEFVRFDIKTHFVSTNFVVVHSFFETIMPKSWLGANASEEKVFISIPVVTILHFNGEKIDTHTDYADYKTYINQIRLQVNKPKKG